LLTLPIRTADVIVRFSLLEIHKDPFDRILVAQSLSEGIPLITKDETLALYGIPTIWRCSAESNSYRAQFYVILAQ